MKINKARRLVKALKQINILLENTQKMSSWEEIAVNNIRTSIINLIEKDYNIRPDYKLEKVDAKIIY